jgi:O-acetyl-ADP-ribose deacetylase (regulator of RNase III)
MKDTGGQLDIDTNRTLIDNRASTAHRTSDDVLKFTTPGSITVEVYRQDLLLERVDAIVNPANVALDHGGGAARAIANEAGSELRRQCRDYIKKNGELKVTQVVPTTAGLLVPQILHVIHAAGPQACRYPDERRLRQAVFDTFYNCFQCADGDLQLRSLSIPAISSGMFVNLFRYVGKLTQNNAIPCNKMYKATNGAFNAHS